MFVRGLALLALTPLLFSQSRAISIVYPWEHANLSAADSVMIFGQVHRKPARLFINGWATPLSDDGAFIQFIPVTDVSPDSQFAIQFKLEYRDTIESFRRTVIVPIAPPPIDPLKPSFDHRFLSPSDDVSLKPGDDLTVACRTVAGARVRFSIVDSAGRSLESDLPMGESLGPPIDNFGISAFGSAVVPPSDSIPGWYASTYRLPFDKKFSNARIVLRAEYDGEIWTRETPGRLSTWSSTQPKVVELTEDFPIARVAPGRSYYYFLPAGVRAIADGRVGNSVRLALAEQHEAWVPASLLRSLPAGSRAPRSIITVVRARREGQTTAIKLTMGERLPFLVMHPSPNELRLSVFGGIADTDWIRFENSNDAVRQIQWSQPERDVYQLTVLLKDAHEWGYETGYDGSNLIWKIRHKPSARGLKGLKLCVDPGHTRDPGATGPRGTVERQANVEIAQKLKQLLIAEGATVIMTHEDTTQGLSLADRVRIANENRCDLFVSIHHNSVPDGVNPFNQNYGPSVIYYHPQSQRLAENILSSLIEKTKLPNFGLLQGNIAVCRNTQMPAVLVECLFLILPEQERLTRDPKFQLKLAQAIKDGIRNFVK